MFPENEVLKGNSQQMITVMQLNGKEKVTLGDSVEFF